MMTFSYAFSALLLVPLFVLFSSSTHAQIVPSIQFNQAIDSAMAELQSESSFTSFVQQALPYYSVPYCGTKPNYPTFSPIPSNVKSLICCGPYKPTEDNWSSVYRKVSNGLADKLNSKFGLQLSAVYKPINTTEFGYFESLRRAVNTGACDVVVSDTTHTKERAAVVNFATCAYGSSSSGFLRTSLDSNGTYIDELSKLNSPNYIVAFYASTVYEIAANTSLPLAQKIRVTSLDTDPYNLVLQNKIHALISDAADLNAWKAANSDKCSNCYVKAFGELAPFGIFTAQTTRSSSIGFILHRIGMSQLMMIAVLSMTVLISVFHII
ncbi:hypothetical protein C9374_007334 [Naegleria lovaniensis]|uniref:Solute-binding protein family 3/N-terminal domain-containing protein n=1 Tax=Naegleria lovaniensis TaxID=51637 RepID=A0AA88KH41_NAELO|nr:uncharacterized protein C9374_007334 [Naegleria lovaniensis]KAG2379195.1 hypothetical protein C9374_007334 [Naegleria lovaniensis]